MSKKPIIATPLTSEDIHAIVSARHETNAAKTLTQKYKISARRLYKIWEDHGVRWKDQTPTKLPPETPKGGSTRTSASGKFISKEPPPPVQAAGVATQSDASESIQRKIGIINAGNDSPTLRREAEELLGAALKEGAITKSTYNRLLNSINPINNDAKHEQSDDGEASELQDVKVRRRHQRGSGESDSGREIDADASSGGEDSSGTSGREKIPRNSRRRQLHSDPSHRRAGSPKESSREERRIVRLNESGSARLRKGNNGRRSADQSPGRPHHRTQRRPQDARKVEGGSDFEGPEEIRNKDIHGRNRNHSGSDGGLRNKTSQFVRAAEPDNQGRRSDRRSSGTTRSSTRRSSGVQSRLQGPQEPSDFDETGVSGSEARSEEYQSLYRGEVRVPARGSADNDYYDVYSTSGPTLPRRGF